MNASLKKVRTTRDSVVYQIQAPAVASVLTRTLHRLNPCEPEAHYLTFNQLPESTADRFADAFASKPVAGFEFCRNDNGRWFVKVLLRAKPAGQRVAERAVAKADYVDTLDTSAKGTHHCPQCMGTGRYVVGLENGAPKFGTGICYRCKGKGQTTDIDRRRNMRYLEHAAARAMSCNH